MAARKTEPTFYDRLRDRAHGGGGGQPVVVKRTVYGTIEDEAYETADGRLYRVRKEKNNG